MRPTARWAVMIATLCLAACQRPHPAPPSARDMAMGSPAAPVTVIEYASVACPACASFNNAVFPAFKARYVDTGKVRWILREALTGDTALAAAGFLTAHCAGKDKYFSVVDDMFHAQSQMFSSGNPEPSMLEIAGRAGLTPAQFQACIRDPAALAAIEARWREAERREGVRQTPTFVVNGRVYQGALTGPELDGAVARAQGAKL
ncbi:MAG TPA: thioredoxin domain-containing protein [Caulobacteraceae bacterium]|nr:thioredoxin domain-containing protein [Caulobacteraceae bacterium]